MNKAKIMLTVVAIVGIISGALAFKVRTTFQIFKRGSSSNCCPLIQNAVYDPVPNGIPHQSIYTTVNPTTTCVPTSLCTRTVSLIIE